MTTTDALNGYGPLAGLKVVELCTYVAGPATVRVLSDLGAEVIKVEAPVGDAQRVQGPLLWLRPDRDRGSHLRPEQHQQEHGVHQHQASRGPRGSYEAYR